jgi:nicotinamidase/pyrazinamidase
MRLDPRTTVFVDVDTQIDFVEPTGSLYVPSAETLRPSFARLVETARAHGLRYVASSDAHAPDDPEFLVFPPHCVAGTPGQRRVPETELERALIVPVHGALPESLEARAPIPLDADTPVVLEKVAFDLFTNPAAEAVLAATGATTAVVFGVALDYCVRAAALGLRSRGYETVLVHDATAPVTAEGGVRTELELREAGVLFASTAEIVSAFG